ncbi:START domain-containing protein [Aliidiomarina sp.]|uniref:START domain-containing protein n=1 Tax=Aliidiomarina sp. TaxID=1872439 RepID=UPI003A4E0006
MHTEFNSFWPIANRDMVTRSTWQYDAESGALAIAITDASEEKPANGRVIRMTDVTAHWQLQPTENGTLQVHYQSDANPKGNIPRAIARSAALNAIEKTLNALSAAMSHSDYQHGYHSIPCENR